MSRTKLSMPIKISSLTLKDSPPGGVWRTNSVGETLCPELPILFRETELVYYLTKFRDMPRHSGSQKPKADSFPGKTKNKRLLRVDGRLRLNEDVSYDTKHLIILPKDHLVTKMIVADGHENL